MSQVKSPKRSRKCQIRDTQLKQLSEQAKADGLDFRAQSVKQVEREAKALFAKQLKAAVRQLAPDETFLMLTRFVIIDSQGFIRNAKSKREQTPQYVEWRNAVYARDQYKCVECGSKFGMSAHHIKSWAEYPELRFDVANGVTLCEVCHADKHPHLKRLIQRGV